MTRLQSIGNDAVCKLSFARMTQACAVGEAPLYQQGTLVSHTDSEMKEIAMQSFLR
jgi:hypothetical protein